MKGPLLSQASHSWVTVVAANLLGVDDIIHDENLRETPRRVALATEELLRGHSSESEKSVERAFRKVFQTDHQELVLVTGIRAAGVCPHHLLPVLYTIDFGYVPQSFAIGLSKIPRIIRLLCARAILQESLTSDIADRFFDELKAQGIGVIVSGLHTCMSIRGVEAREAMTMTSAMRGLFLNNEDGLKQEFLELIETSRRRRL